MESPGTDLDRWLSGQKQQTVNLPALVVYGGSNPPLSTIGDWRFTIAGGWGTVGGLLRDFGIRFSQQATIGNRIWDAGVTQW